MKNSINKSKIIIIGGVAAGTAAAASAARYNPQADVSLFEKGPFISYGTCDLPYFISGVISEARQLILYSPDEFQREKRVEVKTGHLVEKILPNQRQIQVRDLATNALFSPPYDRLIIATGSEARLPANYPLTARNVFQLKTLPDAIRLRDYLDHQRPRKVLILGGGFIALEMAEAFRQRELSVTMLHNEELPAPMFTTPVCQRVLQILSDQGIAYHGRVDNVDFTDNSDPSWVSGVITPAGKFIADLFLVAWGFVPNVALARQTGIHLGATGAIAVDEHMRTSIDGIYAAGDCVELKHLATGRPVHMSLATHAAKAGRVAGENAAGGSLRYKGIMGTIGARFFDWELTRTGLTLEQAQAAGFQAICHTIRANTHVAILPNAGKIDVTLMADRVTHRLLGAEIIGQAGSALRINPLAIAIQQKITVAELLQADFLYTPPLSTLWDPILVCARAFSKRLRGDE